MCSNSPVIRTNRDGFGDSVQSSEDSERIGVPLGAEGTQLSDGRGDGTQRVECALEEVGKAVPGHTRVKSELVQGRVVHGPRLLVAAHTLVDATFRRTPHDVSTNKDRADGKLTVSGAVHTVTAEGVAVSSVVNVDERFQR